MSTVPEVSVSPLVAVWLLAASELLFEDVLELRWLLAVCKLVLEEVLTLLWLFAVCELVLEEVLTFLWLFAVCELVLEEVSLLFWLLTVCGLVLEAVCARSVCVGVFVAGGVFELAVAGAELVRLTLAVSEEGSGRGVASGGLDAAAVGVSETWWWAVVVSSVGRITRWETSKRS